MKNLFHKGLLALVMLGLGSLPASAKDVCWSLENGTESAGELRLQVMGSTKHRHFLLNGTHEVSDDVGIRAFPVTGGAVKMGSSAKVTLTETGTEAIVVGDVLTLTSWATHWHLDLSTDDLSGTASAITTLADHTGISSSAATYDAFFNDCDDDDDDDSDDDDSGDDDNGNHHRGDDDK